MKHVWHQFTHITTLSRHSVKLGMLAGAAVQVSTPTSTTLLFHEKGIDFSNTYRWTCHPTHFALEHLRYGATRPVFLLNLCPITPTHLVSSTAHSCSFDTYSATLTLQEQRLILRWSIYGPNKSDLLTLTYA